MHRGTIQQTWRVSLSKLPDICVRVQAQYAYEAWQAARPELLDLATAAGLVADVAFADCRFELVGGERSVRRRERTNSEAERIHRVVAPAQGQLISGSGRA